MGKILVMILQRQIVLLNFPFSNLKTSKVRPAIVLSNDKYNKKSRDVVVIPLTSNTIKTNYDLIITNKSMEEGNLMVDSRAKINRIFNVEKKLIKMNIGKINKKTFLEIKTILSKLIG